MTAGDVMDAAASLLNDTAQTSFSYAVQIPYLNMAMGELQEALEQHNVTATNRTSVALTVLAGVTTVPTPVDLIEVQELWERTAGTNDDYMRMTRRDFLPKITVQTSYLTFWSFNQQVFEFLGATGNIQVKIDYIRSLFAPITSSTDVIDLINSKTFLAYRTAGLCARYIGENPERADTLDAFAVLAIDRSLGINVKGTQSIATRRRPFRGAYKSGGWGI